MLEKRGSIEETQRILQEIERINQAFGYTKRGLNVAAPRQNVQEYFYPRPPYHPLQQSRHTTPAAASRYTQPPPAADYTPSPMELANNRQMYHQRSFYLTNPYNTVMPSYYYPTLYKQTPRYNPLPFYSSSYRTFPYPSYYMSNAFPSTQPKEYLKSPKTMDFQRPVYYVPVAVSNDFPHTVEHKASGGAVGQPNGRDSRDEKLTNSEIEKLINVTEKLAEVENEKSKNASANVLVKKSKKKSKLSAKKKSHKPQLKQNQGATDEEYEEDNEDTEEASEEEQTEEEDDEEEEEGSEEKEDTDEDEEDEEEETSNEAGEEDEEGQEEGEAEAGTGSSEKEDEEDESDNEEDGDNAAGNSDDDGNVSLIIPGFFTKPSNAVPALPNDKFLFNRDNTNVLVADPHITAIGPDGTVHGRNLEMDKPIELRSVGVPGFFQNITKRFTSGGVMSKDSLKETPLSSEETDGDSEKGPFGNFFTPADALKQATEGGGLVIQRLRVRQGGIAIAGPGGVATAGSGGTAIVGPNGLAITHPRGLAIAGPGVSILMKFLASGFYVFYLHFRLAFILFLKHPI